MHCDCVQPELALTCLAPMQRVRELHRRVACGDGSGVARRPASVGDLLDVRLLLHESRHPYGYAWSVDPVCILGYSESQLRQQFNDRYPAFEEYIESKAHGVCRGSSATSPSLGPARSCTEAHGYVLYIHDVTWFVERHGA